MLIALNHIHYSAGNKVDMLLHNSQSIPISQFSRGRQPNVNNPNIVTKIDEIPTPTTKRGPTAGAIKG